MSELRQPVWLKAEEVPKLPDGWLALPTEEACVQLKPGKLYETKTVLNIGKVPVINQSLSEFLGFHNDEPGVHASPECPVVTFANHTCAMRLMKLPFSSIQNVFPKIGKPGVTDTIYFYYASLGRVGLSDYKGHHPIFRKAFIPIPPLPEQKRIAGILSAYDELIDNSQRRIKLLETMARNLYREWFVHFRYPGHENNPLTASPLGDIPKGWEVCAFTEVANVLSGGTPKTDVPEYWDGEIPFFTPRDAPGCFYVQDTDKHVTELGLSKCASEYYPPDTVFITARGTVGKVALPSIPMAMNQSCYALQGKEGVAQRFLFLMTLQQVDYLKTNTGGATFDTIVVDTFRRMQVVKPPSEIISTFTSKADAVFEQINTLQRQIQNLRKTRDLLLPRLLSGQIPLHAPTAEAA
jgi:restriction endonuclease S subunit